MPSHPVVDLNGWFVRKQAIWGNELTVTTTVPNEPVFVIVYIAASAAVTITSIELQAIPLSMSKVAAFSGADPGGSGSFNDIELWTATIPSPVTFARVTILTTDFFSESYAIAFGMTGLADPTHPFDPNPDAIAIGTNGVVAISTSAAPDTIVGLFGAIQGVPLTFTPGHIPIGADNIDLPYYGAQASSAVAGWFVQGAPQAGVVIRCSAANGLGLFLAFSGA